MTREVRTKAEAASLGLKHYFTGLPCKRGHVVERTVKKGDCVQCLRARQARWCADNAEVVNAKSRAWYAKNPEKAKQTRANWREANAEKDRRNIAAYQAANAERLKAAAAAWSRANADKVRAASAAYRARHYDSVLEAQRKWRRENKHKVNAKKSRRIATMLQATPVWANDFFIQEAYHLAALRKRVCGGDWQVDHIVPLRSKLVCGLHCEANLQVIPGASNRAKSNVYWPDMPA